MKVKELFERLKDFDLEREVDAQVGSRLVPITDVVASGECKSGVGLVLGLECEVCDVSGTE